jgi:hypothetical protein
MEKIVIVERIIHKPVPNYITIRVKKPKKNIPHHVHHNCQVLKKGAPIIVKNQVAVPRPVTVKCPVEKTNYIHVVNE